MPRLAPLAALVLASACMVSGPVPDLPSPTSAHETRRTAYPNGQVRREMRLLVWSDGRSVRDGPEREFHPDGSLAAEREFTQDQPTGVWRTWFRGGARRSEVDYATPGSQEPRPNRFWHENGQLAGEGPAVAGVREGRWSYWSEAGTPLRAGSYRGGKRDGPWTFYDESGRKVSEGQYALGQRVGPWTLWDEEGRPHRRSATDPGSVPGDEPEDQ